MFQVNTKILTEAVKSAKSPKMALDGTKLLLGDSEEYKLIFKEVFDLAWRDTTYRNHAIERSAGRKSEIMWKPRICPDEQNFQNDLAALKSTKSQKKGFRVLGRILSEYDEKSVRQFFATISGKEEVLQNPESSSVP